MNTNVHVNPVDLVALVSGVNFAAVRKVLIAVRAIELHSASLTIHDLLCSDIPDDPPGGNRPMIPAYIANELAAKIAQTMSPEDAASIRLQRFLPHVRVDIQDGNPQAE